MHTVSTKYNRSKVKVPHGLPNSDFLDLDDRIIVNTDDDLKFLKISSIICIKAEKDYTHIFTTGGKKFLVLKTMIEWEERLSPKYFIRIHRSAIINLEFLLKVEKWFNYSYQIYLAEINEPLQMSRRYAVKLREKFK